MELSLNWMCEFVDYELDREPVRLAETVSLAVAEVEDSRVLGASLDQVTVAEVLAVEPHPDADRLRIATINDGKEERRIVCGAPNCEAGIKVPLADLGTTLTMAGEDGPETLTIRKANIRGVESCGMLCAPDELGLPGGHDGLLVLDPAAPVGAPLAELPAFADIADVLLEIDNKSLTHRPDLWGHYGFARELAAVFDKTLASYPGRDPEEDGDSPFTVYNQVPDVCPRYTGLLVENVTVGPSPAWLANRLQVLGQNSINNIVDITNYILLELGQPMHAFDAAKLKGRTVTIRMAADGEVFTALDEVAYTLTADDIVIDDDGTAVALAGVMGGLDSGVEAGAARIFLESANFLAAPVRRTSGRHGLRSESSARFEKSLDPESCDLALKRAYQLIREVCPEARAVGGIVDSYDRPYPPITIETSYAFLQRRLGHPVPEAFVRSRLAALGFELREDGDALAIDVPSWRRTKDVSIPEDIVEEVGRLFGYDNITPEPPAFTTVVPEPNPARALERELKAALTNAHGYTEVMLHPWVGPALLNQYGLDPEPCLKLSNALGDEQSLMRPSPMPQLIEAVANNLKHAESLRIFEYGRIYDTTAMDGLLPTERRRLVGACVGEPDSAFEDVFFATKALVLDVLRIGGVQDPVVRPLPAAACPQWAHPGVAAAFRVDNRTVATLVKLHPSTATDCGIRRDTVLFEIDADELAAQPRSRPARSCCPCR
jgi:phenylalanyl-tRNA synthetase beta chain